MTNDQHHDEAGGIDLELFLPFQISQLSSKLDAQARMIMARHGNLTLPQWRILRIVAMGIACNSTAVRKSAGIDKGQFSKTVNALVSQGYIRISQWPDDQRQFLIELTDKGKEHHARIAPDLDQRQRHLFAALTPQQRKMIFPTIHALAQAAQSIEFLDNPDDTD